MTQQDRNYLGRITSFHRGKPKFVSTVNFNIAPYVDLQNFMNGFPYDFDVNYADGAQLDAVGEWVGRSRVIPIPVQNPWFSFDDVIRGFDKGIWQGPYDPGFNLSTLDDDTYRTVLRAKILANIWDGTLQGAQTILNQLFVGSSGLIFVTPQTYKFQAGTAPLFDRFDMAFTVGVSGEIPSVVMLEILAQGLIPIRGAGVRQYTRVTTVNKFPVFGFDVLSPYLSGFDLSAWGAEPSYIVANTPATGPLSPEPTIDSTATTIDSINITI